MAAGTPVSGSLASASRSSWVKGGSKPLEPLTRRFPWNRDHMP